MNGSTVSQDANTAPSSPAYEGLSRDDLMRFYRTMLLSSRLDD